MIVHVTPPNGLARKHSALQKLYKYMTLDRAIKVLQTNSLSFSYPSNWNDPYEKKVVDGKFVIQGKTYDYPLKDKFMATCFTEQYSCEAQWNVYSYSKRQPCVEFCFDKERLLTVFESIKAHVFLGKVTYCTTKDFKKQVCSCFSSKIAKKAFLAKKPLSDANLKYTLRPMFIKRMAFAYENEWRLILTNDDLYGDITKRNSIELIPNLIDCIEGITIGPCKDRVVFNETKEALSKYIPSKYIHESYIRKGSNKISRLNL